MLFDDEDTARNKPPQPKNLETMSIEALHEYITALQDEIKRVEATIAKKQNSRAAADSFFKS